MDRNALESAVQRVRDGDPNAFETIVDETILSLRAHIGFYLSDWSVVDDVLQETYFRLYREIDRYDKGTDFIMWAKTVARYEALRKRTRTQRRRSSQDRCFSLMATECIAEIEDSEDSGLFERKLVALVECLSKLGRKARRLVETRYFREKSLRETAVANALTESAAGVAIHRARKALADCIENTLDTV